MTPAARHRAGPADGASRGLAPALVLRRARAQAGLLVGVVATALVALAVLGACGLLLTVGRRNALDAAATAATGQLDVVARISPARGTPAATAAGQGADGPAGDLAAEVADVLTGALPLPASASIWAESPLLAVGDGFGYLSDAPGSADAATLSAGRWPAGPGAVDGAWEVAVPEAAVAGLGLALGDVVDAAPTVDGPDDAAATVPLRVVGVYTARGAAAPGSPWQRDLLAGAGIDRDHDAPGTAGRQHVTAAGPLLLADGALTATGPATGPAVGTAVLALALRPDAAGAGPDGRAGAARAAAGLREAVTDALGDRADRVVVRSRLGATVTGMLTQHRVTGDAVLVAGLVTALLAAATLLLAGRLLATRREAERALLRDRGADGGRLARQALGEAAVLVLLAAVLAVPAALLGYRLLVALPALHAAGLRPAAGAPAGLTVTLAGGAVLLLAALVGPSLAGSPDEVARTGRSRRSRAGRFARSGADLLLLGLAVVAGLRLRDAGGADAVRVLAPVLALLALAVVGLRLPPLLARLAERRARSSRGFVLPFAATEAARRPRAATALLLLVLATAAATSGTAWAATWDRSQVEQAEAAVPADVVATGLVGGPDTQRAQLTAAVGGAASTVRVLPATDRVTALGNLTGSQATRLVAVDTASADLAGRLPAGTTWAEQVAGLGPGAAATSVPVRVEDGGVALTVTAAAAADLDPQDVPLVVTPTLLLDGGDGALVALTTPEVPADGAEHAVVAAPEVVGGAGLPPVGEVVAVLLHVEPEAFPGDDAVPTDVAVEIGWTPAGGAPSDADLAAAWTTGTASAAAVAVDDDTVTLTADGLRATARVDVLVASLVRVDLVALGFPRPAEVPVLVAAGPGSTGSDGSAGAGGTGAIETGDRVELLAGRVTVRALVVGLLPYVPGVVDGPAVLADLGTLSRATAAEGATESLVDAWWLSGAGVAEADALRDAGARAVVRSEVAAELRDGPLRVGLPAALGLLVVAAVVLALVGSLLHAAEAVGRREPEIARLLAVGTSGRALVATHLVQHAVVDLLAVATGVAAGAAVAWALAPALTVSVTGAPPVPSALVVWPWDVVGPLAAGLVLASTAVVLPVLAGAVRRATAAHLRLGDAA